MKLTYNGLEIHKLGEFTVSQHREYEEGQRAKVTLRVTVSVAERSYADNCRLAEQVREALRTREAVLQWTDSDTGHDYVNQTVTLESEDLPEEWGTYELLVNLVFVFYEQQLEPNNLQLTFTPAGSGAQRITLGNVAKFAETRQAERFSKFHGQRADLRGEVTVSGWLLADTKLSVPDRRAALVKLKREFDAALGTAEGLLQYGSGTAEVFKRTVRPEKPTVEIDQLRYAIAWSFTASYTAFPDEANFATAEYQVEQRDPQTGEEFLILSGRITAPTEAAARTKLEAVRAAVLAQYGYNGANVQQLRNDVTPHAVSANGDGDAFTELSFALEYRTWSATNEAVTFQKTGSTAAVSLGNVKDWHLEYNARRFSDQRSQRQQAGGVIQATGTVAAKATLSVAERRAILLAAQTALLNEVNGADGTLTKGSWSQVVRVESLKADVNQKMTGLDWSLTASYSLFPNESGYATCEYTVDERENKEDGDCHLVLNGRIFAPDEALARAKLSSLAAAVTAQYGYGAGQLLRSDARPALVYANGDKTAGYTAHEGADGTTFLELAFEQEYRKRAQALLSYAMQSSSRPDRTTGLIVTTYNGTVVAGGTVAAAYAAALAKAKELIARGAASLGAAAVRKNEQFTWDTRKITADNVEEGLRLGFSAEFHGKIATGLAYLEVTTETGYAATGEDAKAVSGVVVAVDEATARAIYQSSIRSATGGFIVEERFSSSEVQHQIAAGEAWVGQTVGQFQKQWQRLGFSYKVLLTARTGPAAGRHALSVSNDYLALARQTSLRGSVYASSEAAAAALAATLIQALIGSAAKVLRDEHATDTEWNGTTDTKKMLKYDFAVEAVEQITGEAGVLECRVSVTERHSGVRWIEQPIPRAANGTGGVSIFQDGGIVPGGRQVRGMVVAATMSAARGFADRQRSFLTGIYLLPEEIQTDYEFALRVDGVATGAKANVRCFRMDFMYGEILPLFP